MFHNEWQLIGQAHAYARNEAVIRLCTDGGEITPEQWEGYRIPLVNVRLKSKSSY